MKISHEVPLCLLEKSRSFNDYDYALVHLFEKSEEYFQFYKTSLENGRHVLLDNSLFELGTAFEENKFAHWVEKLKPTEYIIPDSWENKKETIENLLSWIRNYNEIDGKKIGVVQGKTYEEIIECYQVLDRHCDKIAISFDYSYYKKSFPHFDSNISNVFGRIKLLGDLLKDGIINLNKPHHLLGNSLPIEGKFYSKYDWIESVDTSNPIVHSLKKIKYEKNFGLYSKEKQKLHELIYFPLEKINFKLLENNVSEFREYWTKDKF